MKKKILFVLCLLLLLTGCGKIPTLKNGEEAVVTFEDGKNISVDELYNEMKNTYALSTLVKMIDTKVLETEFKDYIETAKNNAESYIKAIKENYESDEKLLADIQNYTGFSSIEAYQESLYLNYMQNHANEEYAKLQISDKDIEKYYKNDFVGDIEVSHILISPNVTDKMSDEEKEAAETAAYNKAQNLITQLKDAKDLKATFKKLAKENSDDEATKNDGGSLGKINKNTLGTSYKELVDAAYSIKDGELYKNVVTTELGYHVIIKTKSYDKKSLKDAKEEITTTLAKDLMNSDNTISIDALQYYRKEQGVEIQDSELQTQYANYIQNLLFNANNAKQ